MHHHDDTLAAFAARSRTDAEALGLILLGSVARGEERPDSDVDVSLVVTEARLRQGLSSVGGAFDAKQTAAFLAWVTADVRKESTAELEASSLAWSQVERAVHLGLVNRGFLIAPFHNMMLVSPATTAGQVDGLVNAFSELTGLVA